MEILAVLDVLRICLSAKGEIILSADDYDEEKVMDMAISAGADDVIIEENVFSVITAHDQLNSVANNLSNAGANVDSQKLIYSQRPLPLLQIHQLPNKF